MNDRVAAYGGLVDSLATELSRSQRARQVGAEYDDLYQEGLIAVWTALDAGVDVVGADRIRDRMRNYMRWLGRLRIHDTNVPYEEWVEVDDTTPAR
jgi:hypothetical protein